MQGRKLSCCKIHRCGNPSKYVVAALPSSQNNRALGDIFIPGGGLKVKQASTCLCSLPPQHLTLFFIDGEISKIRSELKAAF